jgi:hypothetical protein
MNWLKKGIGGEEMMDSSARGRFGSIPWSGNYNLPKMHVQQPGQDPDTIQGLSAGDRYNIAK